MVLLLALADFCGPQAPFVAWPSIDALVKKTRIGKRQVQRLLYTLSEAGELSVKRGGMGARDTNEYTLGRVTSVVTLKDDTQDTLKGDICDTQAKIKGDIQDPIRVTSGVHKGDIAMSPEPLEPLFLEPLEGGTAANRSPSPVLPPEAELWNRLCGALPRVESWTAERQKHLAARRRDPFWVAKLPEAVPRIAASDFCNGRSDRGWRANFDWILRPNTVAKVMEGVYENNKTTPKHDRNDKPNPRNFGLPPNPTRGADTAAAAARRSSSKAMLDAMAAKVAGPGVQQPSSAGSSDGG